MTIEHISLAIEEIVDALSKDLKADRNMLLLDAASTYNLNPILIRRKFSEQFGVPVEMYVPPQPIDENLVRAARISQAVKKARTYATSWFGPNAQRSWGGEHFIIKGMDFIFTAYVPNREHTIYALRVSDHQMVKMTDYHWNDVRTQITPKDGRKLVTIQIRKR